MEKITQFETSGEPVITKSDVHRSNGSRIVLSTGYVPVLTIDNEEMVGAYVRVTTKKAVQRPDSNIFDIVEESADNVILPLFDHIQDATDLAETSGVIYANNGFQL